MTDSKETLAVKVKPLEWRKGWCGSDDDYPCWRGDNPLNMHFVLSYVGASRHEDVDPAELAEDMAKAQAEYERFILSAIVASVPASHAADPAEPIGWLFLNPDAGEEFSENHPIESGEVPDAQNVRAATDETLLSELKDAWELQEQMRRKLYEVSPGADLIYQLAEALKYLLPYVEASGWEADATVEKANAALYAFKAKYEQPKTEVDTAHD